MLELCENSSIVVSNHRDPLFKMGEPADFFGVVLSGAYKLTKLTPAGDETIMHFSTPGDVIAAFIMAQPSPRYPVSAMAMGPSRFLKIPRENYKRHWQIDPALIVKIQSLLSFRMANIQDQRAMVKAPLSQKLAALLLSLLERNSHEDGLTIALPLTRKELADNLGATSESVIRIMSEWAKSGIIETQDAHITLLRPDKIADILKTE